MPAARKLTSTRRRPVTSSRASGVVRTYTHACRVLGYDGRGSHQLLVYADGLVVRRMEIPTALLTRAGVRRGRPDVVVHITEYSSGGMHLHFVVSPRVRDEDLPHAIRTIVNRANDLS